MDPAIQPANVTVRSAGAWIGVPNGTAMSMPRWPALYGVGGGSKNRMMGPVTGHLYEPNTGAPDATWMGPATDRARFSAPAAARLVLLRMECLSRNARTRRSASA